MSDKPKPEISIVSTDFVSIAHSTDKQVCEHLAVVCRMSRKRIIPTRVQFDSSRVSRTPNSVTVHLLLKGEESARVSFVPAPEVRRGR
jgi:hypothetical protein